MLSSRIQIRNYAGILFPVFIYIILNSFLIARGYYYLSLLPFLIGLLWLGFTSLDRFFFLIVLTVPFSIPLSKIIGKWDMDLYLPSELLLAGVLLLVLLKYIHEEEFDKRILRHPLTITVFINVLWIFITSVTSTMPVVSFKFLIARIWFIVSFYLLAAEIFRRRRNTRYFLWLYIIPMTLIIFYVIIRLSGYGLSNQQAAYFVVDPFFADHTSYGAIVAMLIPPLIGLFYINRRTGSFLKILFILLIITYFAALVLSYTRAAWLSIGVAFIIWMIVLLKIKWQYITFGSTLILFLLISQKEELFLKLEQNKQVSSGNFIEHLQSMVNVRNDASNLERLNRWNCALRMFKEKPVFGWGPGTYMFQYAPFQKTWEKTIISTNTGRRGNAHSEYLGPLSEQGIPGLISFISIIGLTLWTGIRVYRNTEKGKMKVMILSVLLGLCTYYVHGIMNNFLDTDKASALFWGFTAIIMASDIYQRETQSG